MKLIRDGALRTSWLFFKPVFTYPHFQIAPASYFDNRAHLNIDFTFFIAAAGFWFTGWQWLSLVWLFPFFIGWGQLFINLPIRSKYNEAFPPQYGFYWFSEGSVIPTSLWFRFGKDDGTRAGNHTLCIYMPWDKDWVRTSYLLAGGRTWAHDTYKKKIKDTYAKEFTDQLYCLYMPYTYIVNKGKPQEEKQITTAKITVREREWRWRAFKWLPYPRWVVKCIEVEFAEEMGPERGSWKGGVTGCSYAMRKGESAIQCFLRMESERKFGR